MTSQRFFGNPKYLDYARLLRRLHQFIREDADETAEGELLRQQMDEPAEFLTQEEVDSLNDFSGDFYTLSGPSPSVRPNPPFDLRKAALDARDAGDFGKALDLLRKNEPYLDPAYVAYFRGSIWLKAGETEIAVDFFQRAMELAPQNGNMAYMWLDALSRVNAGKAKQTAEGLLQSSIGQPTQLVLKAADVVFASTRHLSDEVAAAEARRLVPVFEGAVVQMETTGEKLALAGAIGLLGMCYIRAGDSTAALKWFDKGLQLFPNNVALLIARGIHRYADEPELARRDFEQAILFRPKLAWPYFFLAHYYLQDEQYAQCLNMAQQALPFAPSGAVRADCLEWIAICQANLGYPPETVTATFHAAQELAPENHRIAKNRSLFEESISTTPPSPVQWESPRSEALRAIGQREHLLALVPG